MTVNDDVLNNAGLLNIILHWSIQMELLLSSSLHKLFFQY